jgi:hypothetical protein
MSKSADDRHALRKVRWASDRERLAEAKRLVDLAGTSLPKLRVVTATCPRDHNLFDVYRIGGALIWVGSQRMLRMDTPDGPPGTSSGRHVEHRVDLLDESSTMGNLREPVGTCGCGNVNTSVSARWLLEQCARDDLPTSRRVEVPVKGHPG